MTPEERKALAAKYAWEHKGLLSTGIYPNCCSYHEGFDAALTLLFYRYGEGAMKHYTIKATP